MSLWKEKLKIVWKKWYWKFKKREGNALHYIGGSDVLPPPLCKDEEEKLMKELLEFSGQEEKLKEIKSILIERNLRLVVYTPLILLKKLNLPLMHQDVLKMKF